MDDISIKEESPSDAMKSKHIVPSLNELLKEPLREVEEILVQELTHDRLPMLQAISVHIIQSGGKRIRPLLCLAMGQLTGKITLQLLTSASALEFIHTATLLHDDVIDNGTSRRGKKSAHMIWGNQGAILSGDHMFACAFSMLSGTKNFKIMQMMAESSKKLAEGEIIQLSLKGKVPSFDEHIAIIGNKTAVLFAAGCACGTIFNNTSDKLTQHAYDFGYNFGISFQLIDDILDYQGNEVFGKPIGADFYEGKFTLPLILAYQNSSEEDKKIIHHIMVIKKERSEKDFDQIKKIILASNSIQQAQDVALRYLQNAERNLAIFDTSHQIYNALKEMIAQTLYRKI